MKKFCPKLFHSTFIRSMWVLFFKFERKDDYFEAFPRFSSRTRVRTTNCEKTPLSHAPCLEEESSSGLRERERERERERVRELERASESESDMGKNQYLQQLNYNKVFFPSLAHFNVKKLGQQSLCHSKKEKLLSSQSPESVKDSSNTKITFSAFDFGFHRRRRQGQKLWRLDFWNDLDRFRCPESSSRQPRTIIGASRQTIDRLASVLLQCRSL